MRIVSSPPFVLKNIHLELEIKQIFLVFFWIRLYFLNSKGRIQKLYVKSAEVFIYKIKKLDSSIIHELNFFKCTYIWNE